MLATCAPTAIKKPVSDNFDVVNIDGPRSEKRAPVISGTLKNKNTIGPKSLNHDEIPRRSLETKKVWGLILGPGINRVICHAVAIRALHEKGIRFNVIVGTGMGAVIAAYLAVGTTPEIIEWKFHKFFQKSKDLKVFSSDWIDLVKSELIKDFIGIKIQNTKLTLILPMLDNLENKVTLTRRGDLAARLLENLHLLRSKKEKFSSSLKNGYFNFDGLRKIGIDKLVYFNVLGNRVVFSESEDYLFGLFGKLAANTINLSEYDYQFNLPVESMTLDSTNKAASYIRNTYLFMRKNSTKLKKDYLSEREIE